MSVSASLIGLAFAVVVLLVLIRALSLKDVVLLVKRGLMAILAFFVLGTVAKMFLPALLTDGFYTCARSALFLGVAVVVFALALMLLASSRGSGKKEQSH